MFAPPPAAGFHLPRLSVDFGKRYSLRHRLWGYYNAGSC